jgi:hypothetical protein
MLHPALSRSVATARIEDLHRAAARRHMIRLAHESRMAATPIGILLSASTRVGEDAGVVATTGSYTSSFMSQWSANGSSLNGCTSTQPVER